ncbi:hypothetical protein LOZ58_003136 [Ophidiomyces ophidiicola]|nr:hypothetical protein LOZ58_003136 [Ophidiomyces ophidiicola]
MPRVDKRRRAVEKPEKDPARLEHQERAYIAASRRTDRSPQARFGSARRASELHFERSGRHLRITMEAVLNEEMYEELDENRERRELLSSLELQNDKLTRQLQELLILPKPQPTLSSCPVPAQQHPSNNGPSALFQYPAQNMWDQPVLQRSISSPELFAQAGHDPRHYPGGVWGAHHPQPAVSQAPPYQRSTSAMPAGEPAARLRPSYITTGQLAQQMLDARERERLAGRPRSAEESPYLQSYLEIRRNTVPNVGPPMNVVAAPQGPAQALNPGLARLSMQGARFVGADQLYGNYPAPHSDAVQNGVHPRPQFAHVALTNPPAANIPVHGNPVQNGIHANAPFFQACQTSPPMADVPPQAGPALHPFPPHNPQPATLPEENSTNNAAWSDPMNEDLLSFIRDFNQPPDLTSDDLTPSPVSAYSNIEVAHQDFPERPSFGRSISDPEHPIAASITDAEWQAYFNSGFWKTTSFDNEFMPPGNPEDPPPC